jgi:hypothetical protein
MKQLPENLTAGELASGACKEVSHEHGPAVGAEGAASEQLSTTPAAPSQFEAQRAIRDDRELESITSIHRPNPSSAMTCASADGSNGRDRTDRTDHFEAGGDVAGVLRVSTQRSGTRLSSIEPLVHGISGSSDAPASENFEADGDGGLGVPPAGSEEEALSGAPSASALPGAKVPVLPEMHGCNEGFTEPALGSLSLAPLTPALSPRRGEGEAPSSKHQAPLTPALSPRRGEGEAPSSKLQTPKDGVSLVGWTEREIAEGVAKRELFEAWVGLQSAHGMSGNQAAAELGEPHSKFVQWRRAIEREGFAGLLPKRRQCGAKAKFQVEDGAPLTPALSPRRGEGEPARTETVFLPTWFIPAARYFYLLINRTEDQGSAPEAVLRTISLPAVPVGWNQVQVQRFLKRLGLAALPVCPAELRETVLARRREGTAMLPRRVMQQITASAVTVRQHRNPTNAGLDYLQAPGSAVWITTDKGERQAIRGAGHVIEADDASVNFPVCVPWPIGGCPCSDRYGVKVGRFQWLASVDVWSRYILAYNYTARPRGSYRGEDVVSLMRIIARGHGVPHTFRFERGVWESDLVQNAVRAMGANLFTVYSPHQKPFIEGSFNHAWTKLSVHFPDSDIGRFRGETEAANDLLVKCQRGSTDPRAHFPMLSQALAAIDEMIAEKNATPVRDSYGGRWVPSERFEAAEGRQFKEQDANTEWMFSPYAPEVTVRGNIVRTRVGIMEGVTVPFDFGAEGLVDFAGAAVRCYFDPHEPRCFATIVLAQNFNGRRAGEVLCTAPQINEATAAIRLALGWGDDATGTGRVAKAQAAGAMRAEVRAVLGGGRRVARSEERDGVGTVARVEAGAGGACTPCAGSEPARGAVTGPAEDFTAKREQAARELEEFERENEGMFV